MTVTDSPTCEKWRTATTNTIGAAAETSFAEREVTMVTNREAGEATVKSGHGGTTIAVAGVVGTRVSETGDATHPPEGGTGARLPKE